MHKIADRIIRWIRKQVNIANAKGTIVGLSGGIDSSVTAVLCKRAFPDNTLGIILPCFSQSSDMEHARLVADRFDIPIKEVDISSVLEMILMGMKEGRYEDVKDRLEVANLKPRLRMVVQYYFANKLNYLVVGTGNKSEGMIGYYTKYGDGAVDILPLGDLLKRDVWRLGGHLDIPDVILAKAPSAGLWEGQMDEDELGISYMELDDILDGVETGNLDGLNPKMVENVRVMINRSEHKRRMPPKCEINITE